ncbi:MAG TPA: pinensin family lanthipeptide [Luteibaculaceae bacterium]|nr:pinensin family lanthipeptide [Luteibaculaceae bacterium]
MKKRLSLQQIKVKSFVTAVEQPSQHQIMGGAQVQTGTNGCTAMSCGIVACTRIILQCL